MAQVTAVAGDVVAVTAGDAHSFFVKSNGTLWAMGGNAFGQLGDGTTTGRTSPTPVAAGAGVTGATRLVCGGTHTLALLPTIIGAWGANASSQLGDGTTANRLSGVWVLGF